MTINYFKNEVSIVVTALKKQYIWNILIANRN